MTEINPSYLQPSQQTLETLLNAVKYDIMKNINCAKVGTIQSFNAALQEATIAIAFTQVTSVSPTGVKTFAQYPLLVNVPVMFPQGGGFALTFPVAEGDECLVVFNDRQIDNWLATGAGQPPSIGRAHDLSDGIAIMGMRNNTRTLAGVSTTSTQLRSVDGSAFVDVSETTITLSAQNIVLHGSTRLEYDAGGTGVVYTPSLITSYTNGVATASNPPSPPGPL